MDLRNCCWLVVVCGACSKPVPVDRAGCPSPAHIECPASSAGAGAALPTAAVATRRSNADWNRTVLPERVIAVVTMDFNDDGVPDRAQLLLPEDESASDAELWLYLSPPATNSERQPQAVKLVVHKRNAAWVGQAWGTMPELRVNSQGSLVVVSQNDAVGRDRFRQEVVVAYRKDEFVVVGLTYATRDTLDPSASVSCDVNFLTGKRVRNGKTTSLRPAALHLAAWTEDLPSQYCGDGSGSANPRRAEQK
jgi:hypothetical protein